MIDLPEGYMTIPTADYAINLYEIIDLNTGVFDIDGCPLCPVTIA